MRRHARSYGTGGVGAEGWGCAMEELCGEERRRGGERGDKRREDGMKGEVEMRGRGERVERREVCDTGDGKEGDRGRDGFKGIEGVGDRQGRGGGRIAQRRRGAG